ncbi:MAG: nitroreductase [Verrucomicrobiales bacterium]|nr:nitroreductase [Verrucomicrobiales bacterium]
MSDSSMMLETVMRARRTEKVMCDVSERREVPPEIESRNKVLVLESLEAAGWAPFHYPRRKEILEPWRAHILWSKEVTRVTDFLSTELKLQNKLPRLCAACSALVLATWIPQEPNEGASRNNALDAMNAEHLAAASAMVQNLLLMLTAHEMGNYWSSGGDLGSATAFEFLGIPADERLLGAIFVEYPEMKAAKFDNKDRQPGKLREKRGTGWIKEVVID